MDTLTAPTLRPTAAKPLRGVTILLVEDSRLASEAIRLMSIRSGARLLRADSVSNAKRHLRVFRPGCVIADLGLPDGSGAELLSDLANSQPRIDVLLGMSGDPWAESLFLAAGADGFLTKPLASLALFQRQVLSRLPDGWRPQGPRSTCLDPVEPDADAYREDLSRVSALLATPPDGTRANYIAQFLSGVAMSAGDRALAEAAAALAPPATRAQQAVLSRVRGMLDARLQAEGPI